MPSIGDGKSHEFIGARVKGKYFINDHITIHADVNGALNILHKAGFDIYIVPDSNIDDYYSLDFNMLGEVAQ